MTRENLGNTVKRVTAKVGLQFVLIGLVVLIPLWVYSAFSQFDIPSPLPLVGALTYPLYIGYWANRIRRDRLRVFILHLIGFLTLTETVMQWDAIAEIVQAFSPLIGLLPSLMLALYQRRHGATESRKSHLYAFLLLLPVALVATGIFVFGIALGSAMRGLRY
jgi:hypothetical protein